MRTRLDRQAGQPERLWSEYSVSAWLYRQESSQLCRARRALLIHLLDHGTGTADDMAHRLPADPDGRDPRWRGPVPGALARAGIIRRIGFTASCRPSRHASAIAVWELADRDAPMAWLSHHPELPEPQPDDVATAGSMPVEPAVVSQMTMWRLSRARRTHPGER
jgi:hypothetical protein